MRIAADGQAFDIDNLPQNDGAQAVEIIQYMHPYGRRRRMLAPAPEDIRDAARDMIVTAEEAGGKISLTVRYKNESAEGEIGDIADNGPGENSPHNTLFRLIREKAGLVVVES